MKERGVIHGQLSKIIAELGHGESIVLADAGLPVAANVPLLDLALSPGIPSLEQVLNAILTECVVESAVLSTELKDSNPSLFDSICRLIGQPVQYVSHDELKQQCLNAKIHVRTGEWTPFANVILSAGVAF